MCLVTIPEWKDCYLYDIETPIFKAWKLYWKIRDPNLGKFLSPLYETQDWDHAVFKPGVIRAEGLKKYPPYFDSSLGTLYYVVRAGIHFVRSLEVLFSKYNHIRSYIKEGSFVPPEVEHELVGIEVCVHTENVLGLSEREGAATEIKITEETWNLVMDRTKDRKEKPNESLLS